MSNTEMSVCEQSFHFASTKDEAIGGNKQNSMLFANFDAKTVS